MSSNSAMLHALAYQGDGGAIYHHNGREVHLVGGSYTSNGGMIDGEGLFDFAKNLWGIGKKTVSKIMPIAMDVGKSALKSGLTSAINTEGDVRKRLEAMKLAGMKTVNRAGLGDQIKKAIMT